MTLLYWWMHWFWITSRLYFGVCDQSNLTHSILPVTSSAKIEFVSNPPINLTPSNVSMTKKPSAKKFDMKNSTKAFPKEVTVINANTTEESMLINSTFNHNDSLTYSNETNFNQSLLLSLEKSLEKDEDFSSNLSAAGITGITLGCVVIVGVICGVSYFLYRNRGFNRPQVLNDRCSNPDSSGYIDDASVRDNSEEMYSLDNDSFLNSLEAMTIQNYWTDTVKHTKL